MRFVNDDVFEHELPLTVISGDNNLSSIRELIGRQHQKCITNQSLIVCHRIITAENGSYISGSNVTPHKARFTIHRCLGRYSAHSKFTSIRHTLKFNLLNSNHIGCRCFLLERKSYFGKCMIEMYTHAFIPAGCRYGSHYIHMIGSISISRIIQQHL